MIYFLGLSSAVIRDVCCTYREWGTITITSTKNINIDRGVSG